MVDVMFCRETSMMAPLDLNLKLPTGYNAITHNTYTQSWLDNFKSYIQKASVKTVSIWEWNCIAADKAAWAEIPWVQGNVATRNAANEMFAYYKALADSSELCRSTNTICWVPPEPNEVYTSSRVKVIDAAVNAAKAKMGSVTAVQKERMEAQFQYWNNAKALV